MRKRTIKYCFDTVLWGIITLLPLILYLIFIFGYLFGHRTLTTFIDYTIDTTGFKFFDIFRNFYGWFVTGSLTNNVIYNAIYTIFNTVTYGLVIDGSSESFICWFASWIINVQLLHIVVDFILILPRICRKFLDKFKSEDC